MPRVGDVLSLPGHALEPVRFLTALIQVLAIPNRLRASWAPVCFAHTAHTGVRLTKILWRMNRDTGGRQEEAAEIRPGDRASVELTLSSPLLVEPFERCPRLGRIVLADGNVSVAIGKVTAIRMK